MSYIDKKLESLRAGAQVQYATSSAPQVRVVQQPSYTIQQPNYTVQQPTITLTSGPSQHVVQTRTLGQPQVLRATPVEHNGYSNLPNHQTYTTNLGTTYKYDNLNQIGSEVHYKGTIPLTTYDSQNYGLKDVHNKIHKDIDDRLKIDTEKRETELMIDAELEKQKLINQRFEDQQRRLKDEIFDLENRQDELDIKVEQKRKLKAELAMKITDLGSQSQNIEKENDVLKNELLRLKDLANSKITELQSRLNESIAQLESEKIKNKNEAEAKKSQNIQKLERLDQEYSRKLEEWNNKFMTSEDEKRYYQTELEHLK